MPHTLESLRKAMDSARKKCWKGTIKERRLASFWSYACKTNSCWLWTGAKSSFGYGIFGSNYKHISAHRFSWEIHRGKIKGNLQIDHLCRNPSCVNPDHLEPVTQRENILRGFGATALLARKTHCKYGHPLSGENLYLNKLGQRNCRRCRKRLFQEWKKEHPDYWKKRENACIP